MTADASAKRISELKRAEETEGVLCQTHIGGQALIEGVMMRGKYSWAAAVRTPDGSIHTEEHDLNASQDKHGWLYWPVIRGCRALVESLVLGYKALEVAANNAFDYDEDEGDDEKPKKGKEKPAKNETVLEAAADDTHAGERETAGFFSVARKEEGLIAGDGPAPSDTSYGPSMPAEPQAYVMTADEISAIETPASDDDGAFEAALSSLDVPAEVDATVGEKVIAGPGEAIAESESTEAEGASVATVPAEPVGDAPIKAAFEPVEAQTAEQAQLASPEPAKPAAPAKDEKPVKSKAEKKAKDKADEPEESKAVIVIGSILGIVLGLALFIFAPAFIANLIVGDYDSNIILWNVVDGVLRVAIFILYIWLISFMKDIKRMFRYHGAEHKTIHCFEHGLELTPENARQFPTLHVRCGTAFLIMTLILAIIVFSCVPVKAICIGLGLTEGVGQFLVIVLSRIVFIPVVAGLGYELTVKWAGSHPERKIVRIVLWPGLQMQRLTTGEPDDSMLECAIAAMKIVLERERREEAKAAAGEPVPEPEPAPFCGDIAAASAAPTSGGTALTDSL